MLSKIPLKWDLVYFFSQPKRDILKTIWKERNKQCLLSLLRSNGGLAIFKYFHFIFAIIFLGGSYHLLNPITIFINIRNLRHMRLLA